MFFRVLPRVRVAARRRGSSPHVCPPPPISSSQAARASLAGQALGAGPIWHRTLQVGPRLTDSRGPSGRVAAEDAWPHFLSVMLTGARRALHVCRDAKVGCSHPRVDRGRARPQHVAALDNRGSFVLLSASLA